MHRVYDQVITSSTEPVVEVIIGELTDEISRQVYLLNRPPNIRRVKAEQKVSVRQ